MAQMLKVDSIRNIKIPNYSGSAFRVKVSGATDHRTHAVQQFQKPMEGLRTILVIPLQS